jgi:hypothetical protein
MRLICDISYLQLAVWASLFPRFFGGDKPLWFGRVVYSRCGGVFVCLRRFLTRWRADLHIAGIRAAPMRRGRCPCAGRHLLFFAAAKKSRQKKAAHTASPCFCPRAPNVPTLQTALFRSSPVANALRKCLTHFTHRRSGPQYGISSRRPFVPSPIALRMLNNNDCATTLRHLRPDAGE